MNEPIYSFTMYLQSLRETFSGVGAKRTILAVLAVMVPEPEWEGCQVFTGPLQVIRGKKRALALGGREPMQWSNAWLLRSSTTGSPSRHDSKADPR